MDAIQIEHKDLTVQVTLTGEITLEVTNSLKQEIDTATGQAEYEFLVLDLSNVTFIDSSGIGFLVALNTRIKGTGKSMHLFRPSQQVLKTLHLVQLISFFNVVEDEEDLLTLLPE